MKGFASIGVSAFMCEARSGCMWCMWLPMFLWAGDDIIGFPPKLITDCSGIANELYGLFSFESAGWGSRPLFG